MSRGRIRAWCAIAVFVLALPGTADAYIHLGFEGSGGAKAIKWNVPRVRWYANNGGVPGVSASQFQSELAQAFMTWESVPTASIAFEFGGFTSAAPFEDDDLSVFGFQSEPAMDRVLGATSFIVDVFAGTIIESDVFFNSIFPWSVAAAGDPLRFDVRSVATHEIGHFLGLGHSAIGETELRPEGGRRVLGSGAVMFPISLGRGVITDRDLQPDDIAGVSDLYPDGAFRDETGMISGRVRLNTAGVKGAHVVAFNPQTGALVGNFTVADSSFRIAGLSPGPYVIRVEPIDDADVDSFMDPQGVNVNFQATFHPRLIVAPRGGSTATFDVTVRSK
jgi:Matrixin